MRPTTLLGLLLVLSTLAGCADFEYRRAHGLEWRMQELQQDRELLRQGFSPYGSNT